MGIRIEHDDNEHLIPVHLVGSIPLAFANDVFDLLGRKLSNCCRRFPDGETGERKNWIGWQLRVFSEQPALIQSEKKDRDYQLHPPFTFRPGYGPDDLSFNDLGFAREASSSFNVFGKNKQQVFCPRMLNSLLPCRPLLRPSIPSRPIPSKIKCFQCMSRPSCLNLGQYVR